MVASPTPTLNHLTPDPPPAPVIVRPVWAFAGLLILAVVWLGLIAVKQRGDLPASLTALALSAERSGLPGLSAQSHLLAAECYRRSLLTVGRDAPEAQPLLQAITHSRMAAARQLLQSGNTAGAERLALEGARDGYDDLEARIMLLETRLQSAQTDAARRELMLLLLRQEHPQALYLLGQSFLSQQRLDDAESFFRRTLALDSEHLASLLGLSEVYLARRDRPAAVALLNQAAALTTTFKQRREVAWVRQTADSSLTSRLELPLYWLSQHYGSLLFALAYALFLFTPLWQRLIRRRRLATAPPGRHRG